MAYSRHAALSLVVWAAVMALVTADAGEEFMPLAPGMAAHDIASSGGKDDVGRKVSMPEEEKKPLPVNVIKLTLPPIGQSERGFTVRQGDEITVIGKKPVEKLTPPPILAEAPMFPEATYVPTPARTIPEAKPLLVAAPASAVTPETVIALSPLDMVADIPGCITPDVVAADKRPKTVSATRYSAQRDDLLDLVSMDAFPEMATPVGFVGVSPELPAMPVYRDTSIDTLEPFVPAPSTRKPQPEQVRLPPPIVTEQKLVMPAPILATPPVPAVQGRMPLLTATTKYPLTATPPPAAVPAQGLTLKPPPDSAFPITGGPARAPAAGASLLVAPMGMSLTASMSPPSSAGYRGAPMATAQGGGGRRLTGSPSSQAEYHRPLPRKKAAPKPAPSLTERNTPIIDMKEDDGITTVRGIRNLLGQ